MVKRPKVKVSPLAIIMLVSFGLVSCAPVTSQPLPQPHLNPDEAPLPAYNDVSLLLYMASALDFVLARKPQEIEGQRQRLPFATIRPKMVEAMAQFFQSASDLSGDTVTVSESDLDTITSLAKRYSQEEAAEQAYSVLQKLPRAIANLDEMEKSFRTIQRVADVLRAPEGSALKIASLAGEERLTKIRQTMEILVSAVESGNIQALLKQAQTGLEPTKLSLEIAPLRAFVGDTITFQGRLASQRGGLEGRSIVIEGEGGTYATVRSETDGYYSGKLTLPSLYKDMVSFRARFLPEGMDVTAYIPALSPPVKVETPFYTSRLHLDTPARAYPGLSMIIKGRFDYADPPPLGARKIGVFIDRSPAGSVMVSQDFQIELPVANNMSLGRHQIAIEAPAQGRYGQASAEALLDVARAIPVVDLKTPRLTLIPWSFDISGKVGSEVAPLRAAQIRLKFGQRTAEVTTSADGTFYNRFNPGFFSTLIGRQGLEVEVVPSEPWHDSVSVRKNIIVFNPGGFAFLLTAVIAVTRWVWFRNRARSAGPLATEAISGSSSAPIGKPLEPMTITLGADKDRILQLYRGVVRFIMGSLGVIIRPHLTLRELVKELAPRLSVAAAYLWQMTLIVERAIYSKHPLAEKDKEDIEKLSVQVTEGIKHGPS